MDESPAGFEERRSQRKQLKVAHRKLFEATSALLFRHDTIGINFETNTDEYEPEVGTILPRLGECQSADDVCRVVHGKFTRWFDDSIAGPASGYRDIADELWTLWQKTGLTKSSDRDGHGAT